MNWGKSRDNADDIPQRDARATLDPPDRADHQPRVNPCRVRRAEGPVTPVAKVTVYWKNGNTTSFETYDPKRIARYEWYGLTDAAIERVTVNEPDSES